MCCRYYMEMSPELRPIIEEANRSALKERIVDKLGRPLITEGEVRPTNIVPVIAPNRTGARTVFPMVWGFTLPRSSSPMVNARVETASTKPTFKESWERRRCIVPASYYFEWEHLINAATGKAMTGDKYMIQHDPAKRIRCHLACGTLPNRGYIWYSGPSIHDPYKRTERRDPIHP